MTAKDAAAGELRTLPRVKKLFYVSYLATTGEAKKAPISLGLTVDISPAGVGIQVYKELTVGTEVEMEIDLEGSEVQVRGTIVHVNPRDDRDFIIGVRFDERQESLAAKTSP